MDGYGMGHGHPGYWGHGGQYGQGWGHMGYPGFWGYHHIPWVGFYPHYGLGHRRW